MFIWSGYIYYHRMMQSDRSTFQFDVVFYKIDVFLELTTHVLLIPIGERYISGKCQFMQEEIFFFSPLFKTLRCVKEILKAYISFTKAPSQLWRSNWSKKMVMRVC